MGLIGRILVNALAIALGAWLLPGIEIKDSIWTLLGVAFLLGILNAVLKPILIILTIPITILTLGLFLLAINAIVILVVDWMVDGFYVESFWSALLLSFIIWAVNAVVGRFEKEEEDGADNWS